MPQVTPLHADDARRVGRYRLTGRIVGTAGAGPVYLAKTVDGSDVTVTLLDGDWTGNSAARDRFTAEANAASRVAPFCAARILAAGFDGGQAFLVSEYVAGPSLMEFVAEEGPWRSGDLEALAIGTATGLAAIHQAGLVHGDFGPEHVVLGADGPRVVEFGITPPYGAATPAADMRAWAQTVLYAAAGGPADPADPEDLKLLPEPLRTLALQCLSAYPADQPTARTVVVELLGDSNPPAGVLGEGSRRAVQAAVHPEPEPVEGPATVRRGRRRRAVTIWWVTGVTVCIVVIAVAIRIAQAQSGQPPAAVAPQPTRQPATSPPRTRPPTPSPTPVATVPATLAGTWTGSVSQSDPSDTFSVTVILTAGGSGGSVHYLGTSFKCAADLSVMSAPSGSLKMNQQVVAGPCEGGTVTLIPGLGSTLQFGFKGKQGPAATGTLTRTS
jgi:eukaryotic-like serine/threonine-protein kinase